MIEIICDSCGATIGKCSKDLSAETVYCETCTPEEELEEDDEEVEQEEEEKP